MTTVPINKPIVRWAGSKRKLLPVLSQYWNCGNKRYVEPFAGSACLFFYLMPAYALLSDINSELTDTYAVVKTSPRPVWEAMRDFPCGRDSYYSIRKLKPSELSLIERAARFLYLNRFCFNGLYRTNKSGIFNVPYSGYKTGSLLTWDSFYSSSMALQNASIENCDFSVTLDRTREGDFVYIDPPYAQKNTKIFSQYGPDTFGINDLERLASQLEIMDRRGVRFIGSYANSEEANAFFGGWEKKVVTTQRNIAGFAKHRRVAEEIIFTNIRGVV